MQLTIQSFVLENSIMNTTHNKSISNKGLFLKDPGTTREGVFWFSSSQWTIIQMIILFHSAHQGIILPNHLSLRHRLCLVLKRFSPISKNGMALWVKESGSYRVVSICMWVEWIIIIVGVLLSHFMFDKINFSHKFDLPWPYFVTYAIQIWQNRHLSSSVLEPNHIFPTPLLCIMVDSTMPLNDREFFHCQQHQVFFPCDWSATLIITN